MHKQFNQGDMLQNRYRLTQQLSTDHLTTRWAAYDTSMHERINLVIFKAPISANTQQTLGRILAQQSGLLHANILSIYEFAETDGQAFYTSQAITAKQAHAFSHAGDFQKQWQILRQVVETLAYAHGLGFCHGLLSADNLLVCGAKVHLLNMGFAPFVGDTASACASPELCLGKAPTPADDMYSLGQLLYKALTGEYRDTSAPLNNQLPAVIGPLLRSMLQADAHKRPTDLHSIKQSIDDYVAKNHSLLPPAPQAAINPSHRLPRNRVTISSGWVLSGLCLLLILGWGLFFFRLDVAPPVVTEDITARLQATPGNEKKTDGSIETPLAPLAAAKLKRLQAEGQAAAEQLLRLQIVLEDKGGAVWAKAPYQQAKANGLAGDGAYANQQYQAALNLYKEAIAILQKTIAQADVVFDKNLALGEAALARGDGQQAIAAFTILSRIKPADASIKSALSRAENLDKVQGLMQRGSIHERAGELNLALTSYQSARSLDSQWLPAKQAVGRIKQLLADRRFNQQMSNAFKALNNNSYDEAKTFFNKAQRLRPASPAPQDGLAQLLVLQNNVAIERHRSAAKKLIALEQWQSAIDAYHSIISIASGIQFAHQGKAQAILRLALSNNLDRFINKPTLMMVDSALMQAKKILLEANRITPKGPILKKQINQLSHAISQARVPVPVTLISDKKTLVTVYKVGVLGKFASKSLTLIPGVYTVVGKRKGYQDVSFELYLKGGEPARSLTINCVERI